MRHDRSMDCFAARAILLGAMIAVATGVAGAARPATMAAERVVWKFDVGPAGQKVFEGFTPLGPDAKYTPEAKFGWTEVPRYFEKFSRFEAFPDALTCDYAAPSPPLTGRESGYKGSFEFRLDVPAGRYGVHVISGNYGYLPSQIETAAYDVEKKQYKLPAAEEIQANGQRVYYREFTQDNLVGEFYHDLNTVLRRGMTLWDRVVAWRAPGHTFKVTLKKKGLVLRFTNMPASAIIVWPAALDVQAKVYLARLTAQRRALFPAQDATPPPEGELPPLPADAKQKGYFLFVPHSSEEISPRTIPKPEWMKDEIRSFAALGEIESFTFAVYPLKDLSDCQAAISDLKTEDGATLPASAFDVRTLRYMELQTGMYSPAYKTIANIPLKWGKIPVDQGINRVYWTTIKVPEDAQAGRVSGNDDLYAGQCAPFGLARGLAGVSLQAPPFDRPFPGPLPRLRPVARRRARPPRADAARHRLQRHHHLRPDERHVQERQARSAELFRLGKEARPLPPQRLPHAADYQPGGNQRGLFRHRRIP